MGRGAGAPGLEQLPRHSSAGAILCGAIFLEARHSPDSSVSEEVGGLLGDGQSARA